MGWEKLRDELVQDFYPEDEELEQMNRKYREISDFIKSNFGVKTHFAGSASRATCMKGDRDIDVFVLFPEDTEKQKLEEKGLEIGEEVFKHFNGDYHVEYAEHPYTKGEVDGHEVEVVPCIDTDPEDIQSSVDRTPHHSRWVDEKLSEEQRKDVVLLKKFLKSNGLYGSSLKVQGFSGYVCEVLISYYGDFISLIENAEQWREKKVLDPEEHHKGDLPDSLESKFSRSNMILIDPVDPERNAASVLTKENFSKFIHLCWRFNSDMDKRFFHKENKEHTEFQIKQELKKRADILVLELDTIDEVDDIIYPQMRKTVSRIKMELEDHEFRVFNSGFHVGTEIRIYFELERELPEIKKKKGPKSFHGTDHMEEFSSKYQNTYIEGDRLTAKVEREFTDAKELLQSFLSGDLKSKGIPNRISTEMKEFRFTDPLSSDQEWLNYLGEEFKIEHNQVNK